GWIRLFLGDQSVSPISVAVAPDGTAFVGGYFSGTTNFNSGSVTSKGGRDAFLARLNSLDGATEWVRTWGDSDAQALNQEVDFIAPNGSSSITVTGFAEGNVLFQDGGAGFGTPGMAYVMTVDASSGNVTAFVSFNQQGLGMGPRVAVDKNGDALLTSRTA